MIIGVLVELSNKNIDKIFDYGVPKNLEEFVKVGIRVEVPFGNQTLEGFVLEIKDNFDSSYKLKEIISIKDNDIVLNDELLKLGKVMQENTLATLISCYQVMLPKALKAKQGSVINKKFDTYYRLNEGILSCIKLTSKQEEIVNYVKEKEIVKRNELLELSSSIIPTLIKKNVLIEDDNKIGRFAC